MTVDSGWLSEPAERSVLVTDVRLENLEPRAIEARLLFAPSTGGPLRSIAFLLGPFDVLELPDPFGGSRVEAAGSATLSVETREGLPAPVLIGARAYARTDRAPAASTSRFATGLSHDGDFSADVEAFNTTTQAQDFRVSLTSGRGELLGVREGLSLAPGESASWSLSELFPEVSGVGMTIGLAPERGSTMPAARAGVTDLRTENRVPIAAERPVSRIFLPVDGWTAGAGDTFLASDAAIGNTGARRLAVRVRFLEADRENEEAPSVTLVLEPGEARQVQDVLRTLFGLTGVTGLLQVDAEEPALVAASRGTARSTESTGTLGTPDPPILPDRFATESLLVAPAGSGAITRVGLMNPDELGLPVVLRWVNESGTIVGETATVVPGSGWIEVAHEGATEEGTMVLVTSGRPHFAMAVGAGRIRSLSGNDPRGRGPSDNAKRRGRASG